MHSMQEPGVTCNTRANALLPNCCNSSSFITLVTSFLRSSKAAANKKSVPLEVNKVLLLTSARLHFQARHSDASRGAAAPCPLTGVPQVCC